MVGQGSVEEFGKNRVQYHDDFDKWWMYESENFFTYWYGKGKNIGSVAMQMAEMDYEEIIRLLEHRINDKIEIIVYLDVTDLKQSNQGSEEAFSNRAGQTKIIGNKIFVYFDGSHQHLRQQIREGVATVYIDALLYGSNLQEIVQNAVLLNLPDWFRDGLISYIGSEWNPSINESLLHLVENLDEKTDFSKLAVDHPKVVGHAMWYYIAQTYGKSTIANLLYLTRINRDLSQAFLYVLGTDFDLVMHDWLVFYKNYYKNFSLLDNHSRVEVLKKTKIRDGEKITEIKLHPSRNELVYVTNELGKYRVWRYDVRQQKRTLLFKDGHCNAFQEPDYSYPILNWSDNGHFLLMVHEKRDKVLLTIFDVTDDKKEVHEIPTAIHRIYDADFLNLEELIFSGSDNGYSNLFRYKIKSRSFEKLTDDFYNDLDLSVVTINGQEGVVFSSNRESDILIPRQKIDTLLPLGETDLFYYDLSKKNDPVTRLTRSPLTSEFQPYQVDEDHIVFLSDKTGVWNRRILKVTDIVDKRPVGINFDGNPISNNRENTLLHHIQKGRNKVAEVFNSSEGPNLAVGKLKRTQAEEVLFELQKPDGEVFEEKIDSAQLIYQYDPDNFFSTRFENPLKVDPIQEEEAPEVIITETIPSYKIQKKKHGKIPQYLNARAIASRIKFKLDYFTTNLDNSLLFGGLDSYAGTKQGFENPPLGILLKANMKDLFEDYEIEGGTRITTSFNGSEHFLLFADKKKRIDKHYAIYRRSIKDVAALGTFEGQRFRNSTFIALFQARYPLDIFTSIRGSLTFRNDKYNILASDLPSLRAPTLDEQRVGLKLEYVFDNTLDVDVNIKNGSRYKFFGEVVKRFTLDFDPLLFNASDGFMTVLGLDFRHYQRVLKHSIFAIRVNGATTLGSEKIIFYLGGINNWLFPSFNQNTPFPPGDEYAYQTIAANLRGFQYNIRNGGTYFLVNNEFRFPIIKYLTHKKIRFAPLRNLQFSAFFDLGLAWFGTSPFGRENPVNNVVLNNPSVTVDVLYFRDPLVMGFGWGARTMIFGYFLKFDYAWGLETRKIQDPRFYLSLGLDF